MAERMPNIGESAWHNILGANDGSGGFLRVTLNDDGTLRPTLGQSITPAALSANQDDWAPTGLSTASVIRASTNASWNLTGLTAQTDGRTIIIQNIGSNNLLLIHDQTSTAANRFFIGHNASPGNAHKVFPGDSAAIVYDGTSLRWRVTAANMNPGGAVPLAPSGTGTSGVSSWVSREDHVHPATDIAVDTIWNAAGDIAYATGADAATVLSIGSAFRTIRSTSGATAPEWVGGLGLIGDSGALAASATTIDFSNIPSGYSHIIGIAYARANSATTTTGFRMRVNNVSAASSYDQHGFTDISTVVAGFASAAQTEIYLGEIPDSSASANIFGGGFFVIPHYAGSANRKEVVGLTGAFATESAVTTNWTIAVVQGKNRANTAITQLTFGCGTFGTTAFAIGTRITLYGLGV